MTIPIETITTRALGLALDAATTRQQVIASNIANANTEGYFAQRVSFEKQLQLADRTLSEHGYISPTVLAGLRPRIETVRQADGRPEKVQLDAEMAHLAQNAVQYQALVKGVSRHLSLMLSAASDGRK